MAENGVQLHGYMAYAQNPGFCGIFLYLFLQNYGILQHFHPFDWLARAPEAGGWKAAFLAPSPHTWRNLMPFNMVKLKNCTAY